MPFVFHAKLHENFHSCEHGLLSWRDVSLPRQSWHGKSVEVISLLHLQFWFHLQLER